MTITEATALAAIEWIKDNATTMAQAKANRLYLEQWLKTVKGQIMLKHSGVSNAAQETIAFSSQEYLAALQAYKEAIEIDERFRFLVQAAEAKYEAWRTISANERAGA